MDPAAAKPWMDMAVSYGVPLVITSGVLFLLWRYIPAWIDSSIKAQTQVPIELAKLNDTLREGLADIHQIKKAAKHAAAAGADVIESHAVGKPPSPHAMSELHKMKNALEEERD